MEAFRHGSNRNEIHDSKLASRKAEEAALRRCQAVYWLSYVVGKLDLPRKPSEREFISCLRNGLILCNAVNKIQPGLVPKVVEDPLPRESVDSELQPPPAVYQYFENVRNFLDAAKKLNLPAFESCDLEKENLAAGAAGRVVDCILALKAYHEMKQLCGANGISKHVKSPLVSHSANNNSIQTSNASSSRSLDLSLSEDKQMIEEAIAKSLVDHMVDTKENINYSFLSSRRSGKEELIQVFRDILTNCIEQQWQNKLPETEGSHSLGPLENLLKEKPSLGTKAKKCCNDVSRRDHRSHYLLLLGRQEKDLLEIKASLSEAKSDLEGLQCQFLDDVKQLANLVEDMSTAANGYQKVVQENRVLFNTVQNLKGNIRVYCRIRPIIDKEARSVINFLGNDDGSLVLIDPRKLQNGRRTFQFNRVYGPMASQEEVFKDVQPFVKSVMDGYNVCIFAYGQTGSGKTYTMSSPSSGLSRDIGINHCALNHVFQMAAQTEDFADYSIYVEMVEIYNEQVTDLLQEDSSEFKPESPNHAALYPVKSAVDALNLIRLGEERRSLRSTLSTNKNNLSHSILTIHVRGKDSSESTHCGRLCLVELAGSEREDADDLKYANHVDKSLSCLEEILTALSLKSSHIPCRESKITTLLQDCLGGSAKLLVLAHVGPEADNYKETLSTLKFAQGISGVEVGCTSSLNKQSSSVLDLKRQVEDLKKALVKKKTKNVYLNEKSPSPYDNPKAANGRTPLLPRRIRRLSIENPSSSKMDKQTHGVDNKPKDPRSPSGQQGFRRSRRLSIENSVILKSSRRETVAFPEKILPRSQQPSFGNRSAVNSKDPKRSPNAVKVPDGTEIKSKDPKTPIGQGVRRSRRLSIENPTIVKSPRKETIGFSERTPLRSQQPTFEDYYSGTKSGKSMQRIVPPRSRRLSIENSTSSMKILEKNSFANHAQEILIDFAQQPEQQVLGRNDAQVHSNAKPKDHQTPSTIKSAHEKQSQIRKSLSTIGKLIHVSEKKKHQPCSRKSAHHQG